MGPARLWIQLVQCPTSRLLSLDPIEGLVLRAQVIAHAADKRVLVAAGHISMEWRGRGQIFYRRNVSIGLVCHWEGPSLSGSAVVAGDACPMGG